MIPYGRQDVQDDDVMSVLEALNSDLLTTGKFVDLFEEQLSKFLSTPTFVVSSGTAALHSAYFGIGLTHGDEIITPPNTFIATQAMAAQLGVTVKFADIDRATGLMDLSSAKNQITSRTKAIVIVDYAGQMCDIKEFKALTAQNEILLVQDAAHSIGSRYLGRSIGPLADITTFSFYPTKNITTGEGGAVSSPHTTLLQRAKTFSRQGLVRNPNEFVLEPDGPWHQEVQEFGLNYRLTDIQCALGITQLAKIEQFKRQRRALFERYEANFKDVPDVRTIEVKSYSDSMWHLFPIFVDKNLRKDLFLHLRSKGYGVQVNYFPAHAHPVFRSSGYAYSDFPAAVEFYETEISLPLHTKINFQTVDKISEVIRKFFL